MNRNYLTYTLTTLIITILLLSCNREKNPTSNSTTYNEYIGSWPGLIKAMGAGAVNENLPVEYQQAGSLRAAKVDLYRNILEEIKLLPVSERETIEVMMNDNDRIQSKILEVLRDPEITEINYLQSGACEINGYVLSIDIIAVVAPYLSEYDN